MSDDLSQLLHPQSEAEQEPDPELKKLVQARHALRGLVPTGTTRGGADDWDAPLDLRVLRPRAVDLRTLWCLTNQPEPAGITASLGARRPILLNHLVTPFPPDGRPPTGVWALGYEFIVHDLDANTVSVVPDNQSISVGKVGQSVDLGLELGGKVGVPQGLLAEMEAGPSVSLSGASLRASTNQHFQFAVSLEITLRKVIGAGVGIGGAQWKLYRQNEPLDQPHPLLQTVLVPEGAASMRCTVRTWATQAGWLGTRLGAKFWTYKDQDYDISLTGT